MKKDKKASSETHQKKKPTSGPLADSGTVHPAFEPETSVFRGTGFMGFGRDTNPAKVDVKDGKVIRTRPYKSFSNDLVGCQLPCR